MIVVVVLKLEILVSGLKSKKLVCIKDFNFSR